MLVLYIREVNASFYAHSEMLKWWIFFCKLAKRTNNKKVIPFKLFFVIHPILLRILIIIVYYYYILIK